VIEDDTPLAERLVLVEMLGWTRSDVALTGIFDVLAGVPEIELRSHRVAGALRRGLPPLLVDDARRFQTLVGLLPELPHALLLDLVEVLGDIARPEAAIVLARAAALGPRVARSALTVIAQRDCPLAAESIQECTALARGYLASPDHLLRRLAVVALGRLGDTQSFENLAALLGDEDLVVRRKALESLQELSHVRRDWDAEKWTRWYAAEKTWLVDADTIADNLADNSRRASEAIRELSAHPLFGTTGAELLAEGLEPQDEHVRVLTCEGLTRLGHPAAIPLLIEALDDMDETAHVAAHGALAELTGLDHGPERDPWIDWWRTLQ